MRPGAGESEAPVRVLYVMGSGRSGSTVLDVVLGNHPEAVSAGELTNISRSGWADGRIDRSPFCACGRRYTECPFWSEVRRAWAASVGEKAIRSYPALQDDFERYRRWPRILREGRARSERFEAYAATTRALFGAVSSVSGRGVVVDSSKNPVRALALSMMPGLDLRPVHLVRDARGVAFSRKKAFRKDDEKGIARDIEAQPVWNSVAVWGSMNLLSDGVVRRVGPERSARVRYEDFVRHPESTLAEIGRAAGLDLSGIAKKLRGGEALPIAHNAGGNRLRMGGSVRLMSEAEPWKNGLNARDKRVLLALAGPLLWRYGYRW